MDQGFGFIDEVFKVIQVDLGADEVEVDLMRILSPGKIAGDVCFFNRSQVTEHLLDDLVEPDIFPQDIIDIGKEGMGGIGREDLTVLFFAGNQQPCFLKAVQLQPDGVRGFVEFRFQVAKIGFGVAVQEEPEQQLDAGFAGN